MKLYYKKKEKLRESPKSGGYVISIARIKIFHRISTKSFWNEK